MLYWRWKVGLNPIQLMLAEELFVWFLDHAPEVIMAIVKGTPEEIDVRMRSTDELRREVDAEGEIR